MDNQNKKCSSSEHVEINANSYCGKCGIYMCNKCENLHSQLFKRHQIFILDKNTGEIFTGFCLEENHHNKFEYFCKNHNELCCAACLCKIKNKGNVKHSQCDVCNIEEIKEEKKDKLKENNKLLEQFSNTIQDSVIKLKEIFEKTNKVKEDLKLKIQKTFTKLRNELNNREDELLSEVDEKFENIFCLLLIKVHLLYYLIHFLI